ncbi:MAG: class I adenylate-forming enzyme family protein [Cellvibrionaceae bacterium]
MSTSKAYPYMPIECLYAGLAIDPQAPAAIENGKVTSYRELTDRVETFALALRHELSPGDKVALCALNNLEHLTAFLAILTAGFTWVPINPKNGKTLNEQLLNIAQPALILVDHESQTTLPDNHNRTLTWSLNDAAENIATLTAAYVDRAFSPATPGPDDIMAIKFTGGTTGTPKGVIQTHSNVAAVIDNMQRVFEFNASDRNLAVAPLTHGGSHYILPLLAAGGCHLLHSAPNPEKILTAFRRDKASVSFMPPTLIYKLLDQPDIKHTDFPHLRHLTYSAAPMPPARIKQVQTLIGNRISTVYGQTEAPMTITAMGPDDLAKPELQASVGNACYHSEVTILSAEGQALPDGESGEVAIRGAIVMPRYFDADEKTQDAFHDDWLLTGDVGYLDKQGYLFLKGRSKELIISGGFNVYPAEVENRLIQHPDIVECAVVGVEDDYWGERVEAAICVADNKSIDVEQLQRDLKAQLGSVKTPKAFHQFAQLPRNPVGKVVRRDILKLIQSASTP